MPFTPEQLQTLREDSSQLTAILRTFKTQELRDLANHQAILPPFSTVRDLARAVRNLEPVPFKRFFQSMMV